jgi:hypothetical protein
VAREGRDYVAGTDQPVSAQALEARLAGGAQMSWPPVPTPFARPRPCQAALGRNHEAVRIGRQSFGNQLFTDARTVGEAVISVYVLLEFGRLRVQTDRQW